jgi:hypothetical protein
MVHPLALNKPRYVYQAVDFAANSMKVDKNSEIFNPRDMAIVYFMKDGSIVHSRGVRRIAMPGSRPGPRSMSRLLFSVSIVWAA